MMTFAFSFQKNIYNGDSNSVLVFERLQGCRSYFFLTFIYFRLRQNSVSGTKQYISPLVPLRIFLAGRGLLSSCGTRAQQLWCAGLVAPWACRILVPQPGIEPASPALEIGFSTTGPAGKSLAVIFSVPNSVICGSLSWHMLWVAGWAFWAQRGGWQCSWAIAYLSMLPWDFTQSIIMYHDSFFP